MTEWQVSLLFECTPADTCKQAILIPMAGPAGATVTFPAPPIPGTVQVRVHGWTFAGLQQEDTVLQTNQGGQVCACTGARTPVTPASIGWAVPAAPTDPGTSAANPNVRILLTAFPAVNTLGALGGTIVGLPLPPSAYSLRMWLTVQGGIWWSKPVAGAGGGTPPAPRYQSNAAPADGMRHRAQSWVTLHTTASVTPSATVTSPLDS